MVFLISLFKTLINTELKELLNDTIFIFIIIINSLIQAIKLIRFFLKKSFKNFLS
jgi:hypothetical protein